MVQSFKVAATLAAYRCVSAVTATAQTVQYPPSETAAILGITTDTVKDTVAAIPVKGPGEIGLLTMAETVASGELVAADTNGQGIALTYGAHTTTAFTTTAAYVGVLIDAQSATGTVSQIYIMPGFARGAV